MFKDFTVPFAQSGVDATQRPVCDLEGGLAQKLLVKVHGMLFSMSAMCVTWRYPQQYINSNSWYFF